MIGEDEFVCAGVGAYIKPVCVDLEQRCSIASAEELVSSKNGFKTKLVLNGDQTAHHTMLYLRGRMENADYELDGCQIPAPWYDVSYQRMHVPEWQNKFKTSGIYRMTLMTIPGT